MTTLRLGTRRSTLALAQATEVADRLGALGHDVDLVRSASTPFALASSSTRAVYSVRRGPGIA